MLGRMGPKGRLVPSVHLFSINFIIYIMIFVHTATPRMLIEKKPDNTKNRFPFVPQCPIFGKKRPQQPKSGGFAPILKNRPKMKILSKIVKKWPKIDKKWPKNPIFPDFRKMPKIVDFPKIGSNK